MGKRIKIGLFYNYNENWIGGSYYFTNLIQTLLLLKKEDLPELYIFHAGTKLHEVEVIDYPDLKYIDTRTPSVILLIHKILKKILHRKPSYKLRDYTKILDLIIGIDFPVSFKNKSKLLYWIPDMQERFLPGLFAEKDLKYRINKATTIASLKSNILFSSQSSLNHFNSFYPEALSRKFVYRFSTFMSSYKYISLQKLVKKFDLPSEEFFFSPNQFWAHKNQIVILEALLILNKKYGKKYFVYFSGKQFDYRQPDYFKGIWDFVVSNQLQSQVRFLGFIDRNEQLSLLQDSRAIIQPSLFEGWSTGIEEGKLLNKMIIASNIDVHKEQLGDSAFYFEPDDADALCQRMLEVNHFSANPFVFNYENQKIEGARQLKFIFNEIFTLNKH